MSYQSIESRFAGSYGYPSSSMNPPPAEKGPTVVQFSLTEGCSHGSCTFCTMYGKNGMTYKVKSLPDFKQHVDDVLAYLQGNPLELTRISRIFIGGGNALSADVDVLLEASQYALYALKTAKGRYGNIPRRLSVYGNTDDILKKGHYGMRTLYCGGVCKNCSKDSLGERRGVDVVYWGVESGNDDVLRVAGKKYSSNQAGKAGRIMVSVGVRPSVMIMPGLGGILYSEGHIKDTARLLNDIRPLWVTFIGVQADPNTPYAAWMQKEQQGNRNRAMTPPEIAEQTARIIERLDFPTKLGIHGDGIHIVGHNPIAIGVAEIHGIHSARDVAAQMRVMAEGRFNIRTKIQKLSFS